MIERRIEEASLNSWPALQQILLDGWVLRFAAGYTKRANSVTPLYPSLLPVEANIATCEHLYQEKQLPAIFRLLSFSQESQVLDPLLAQRGYTALDRTLVCSLPLPAEPATRHPALRSLSLTDWLPLYDAFSERRRPGAQAHRQILERIASPVLYATFSEQNRCVACGLGVLEHEILGLFDLVTHPEQRRRGYGTQLVRSMLEWGKQQGARWAYLQVVATNLAAQQMYAKLGFQECYQYWYRLQP